MCLVCWEWEDTHAFLCDDDAQAMLFAETWDDSKPILVAGAGDTSGLDEVALRL